MIARPGETMDRPVETGTEGSVLIVDDEPGPLEALRMLFEPAFRVTTVDRGATALELLERESFDIVTLDLTMPGLSGTETLARMRERKIDAEVIVVTGHGSLESAIEVLRLGSFDYITKPFDPARVLGTVRRALESRRVRRSRSSDARLETIVSELVDSLDVLASTESSHLDAADRRRLAYILLLAQSLRDRTAPNLHALYDTLLEKLFELDGHSPERSAETDRTALDRIWILIRSVRDYLPPAPPRSEPANGGE
jgi:DNA-binding response OmpR family regulator